MNHLIILITAKSKLLKSLYVDAIKSKFSLCDIGLGCKLNSSVEMSLARIKKLDLSLLPF